MKIFLSWSGTHSRQVADIVRAWIPTVLPYTEPWISSRDIDKGSRWALDVASQLDDTNFGIICVVPGNVKEPWLNFEAGAISKSIESGRVAPLLVGLTYDDVTGPLAQFQLTMLNHDDVLDLFRAINGNSESPIDDRRLVSNFDVNWAGIEHSILSIEPPQVAEVVLEPNGGQELRETEIEILKFLAQTDGSDYPPEAIARALDENLTKIKHWLSKLDDDDYIGCSLVLGQEPCYFIADAGRSYLVEHDLL